MHFFLRAKTWLRLFIGGCSNKNSSPDVMLLISTELQTLIADDMCFHNPISARAIKIAAHYGRRSDIVEIYQGILDEQYRMNAFAFPRYPIITSSDKVQVFNRGLIPFWARSKEDATEIREMTLNARADTIFEKPSFHEPIMKKRCIMPNTDYFEWRHEGTNKIPYYIYVGDEPISSVAGVYDRWLDKDARGEHEAFSTVATGTNSLTDYIDSTKRRIPVILTQEEEEKWLSPSLSKAEIASLLKPLDIEKMDAYVIRGDFLEKSPNDSIIVQRTQEKEVYPKKVKGMREELQLLYFYLAASTL